jgi:hypothetical protein
MDLPEKNLKAMFHPVENIDLGVAATSSLSKAVCGENARLAFRVDCQTFLVSMTRKIIERSPMRYKIVRLISCLSPKRMFESKEVCEQRMGLLCQDLYERKRISAPTADSAKMQYATLLSAASGKWMDKFNLFSKADDRLDTFYAEIIGQDPSYADLWCVMRLVLILSHGNASVESGFSINSDFLVENLHEESLIAQRQLYDGILAAGGVLNVAIEKSLLQLARSARSR